MNELEMELGRTLGASCFFVYQALKQSPSMSRRDIEMETGLSEVTVLRCINVLKETNVIKQLNKQQGVRPPLYAKNEEKETWKFH